MSGFCPEVVEATPVALLMLDAAGRVTLVNAEAERLFGCGRDALLGRTSDDLFTEGFPHRAPRGLASTASAPTGPRCRSRSG